MKASAGALLDDIGEDFSQFLMSGRMDLTSFSRKIDPNLRIDNVERLLRVHFILTRERDSGEPGVVDFVSSLPQRLRRIKTSVLLKSQVTEEGEIKGRVNWKDTLVERHRGNPRSSVLFVCDEPEKEFRIPENVVLKELLGIIRGILEDDLVFAIENDYPWIDDWIREKDLRMLLEELYFKNVYLKRIELGPMRATDRMIARAVNSRNVLYKQAGILLRRYRRLLAYDLDPREAKQLLQNTFIRPERTEVLFELYWAIRIARQFKGSRFQIIEPGSNVIAKWEHEGYLFELYHDSSAGFKFEEPDDIEELLLTHSVDDSVGRGLKALDKFLRMTSVDPKSWRGRPDLVLKKFDQNGKLVVVLVAEVKYTDDKEYALKGLKELLEYLAIAAEEEKYLEEFSSLFDEHVRLRGVLFVDRVKGLTVEPDGIVRVVMFGDQTPIEI